MEAFREFEIVAADLVHARVDVQHQVLAPVVRLNMGADLPIVEFLTAATDLFSGFCHRKSLLYQRLRRLPAFS